MERLRTWREKKLQERVMTSSPTPPPVYLSQSPFPRDIPQLDGDASISNEGSDAADRSDAVHRDTVADRRDAVDRRDALDGREAVDRSDAVDGDDAADRNDAVDGTHAGDVKDDVKAGTSVLVATRETRTTDGKKKPRWVYVPPERARSNQEPSLLFNAKKNIVCIYDYICNLFLNINSKLEKK